MGLYILQLLNVEFYVIKLLSSKTETISYILQNQISPSESVIIDF